MKRVKRVKLLKIISDKAFSYFTEDCPTFDDNGGAPDGSLLLREVIDFPQEVVEKLLSLGLAEVVDGYAVYDYDGSWEGPQDFCGFQAEEVAYTPSLETARYLAKAGSRHYPRPRL